MNTLPALKRWILLPGSGTVPPPADRSRKGYRETNLADLFRRPFVKGAGRPALLPIPVPSRTPRRP